MMDDIFHGMRHPEELRTIQRLRDRYGLLHASRIIGGLDRQTNDDIARWNALGANPSTGRSPKKLAIVIRQDAACGKLAT